jgi:hypothetical protein
MIYEPATRVGSGETPGAQALEAWFIARGFGSSGIYNPRNVAGTSTLSLHAEGRAVDVTPAGRSAELGRLLEELVRRHLELGVQLVIWERTYWRVGRTGWQRYTGVNPHTDHAHVELTRAAAAGLTVETIDAVMSGSTPEEQPEMNAEERAMFDQIHYALVGGRRFAGDLSVYDLAAAILETRDAVKPLPGYLGDVEKRTATRIAELGAAMPLALDLEHLAGALAERLAERLAEELVTVDAEIVRDAVLAALTDHPLRPSSSS